MIFRQLLDLGSCTFTYLIADETSREAIFIDTVLEQSERDLTLLRELGLKLKYCVETHIHADHITGMSVLHEKTGCAMILGEKMGLGPGSGERAGLSLARQGDLLMFGNRFLEVYETPGHTNGCLSLVMDDRSLVFTGDALFIRSCGRTDLQSGNPSLLYQSVKKKLFTLPDHCVVFPGHDFKGMTCSTIGEEKLYNPRLGGSKTEAEFVAIMNGLKLAPPKKLDVCVPANLQLGATAMFSI